MPIHLQPVEGDVPASVAAYPQRMGLLSTWHLLSLDAPTVATVWTWFVAEVEHVPLPSIVLVAMFLAVWILYSADRLLDGMGTSPRNLEARHRFHSRHRFAFRIGLAVASIVLFPLVIDLPGPILRRYLELAMLLTGWFVVVHVWSRTRALRLPKELMPGIFCSAAAYIPVWVALGFDHVRLAVNALGYALLVTLNCLCIYAWEHDNLAKGHWTARIGAQRLNQFGSVLIMLCAFTETPIGIATGLSASLLLALNYLRTRIDPTNLRAASDLVLLTPLVVAPFLR